MTKEARFISPWAPEPSLRPGIYPARSTIAMDRLDILRRSMAYEGSRFSRSEGLRELLLLIMVVISSLQDSTPLISSVEMRDRISLSRKII